jgi:hypothetical protein
VSFINEANPAAVQHRNWNWKLGQDSSVVPSVAFIVVPGTQAGSKYSTGGIVYTPNDLDPDNGSGSNSWRGGAYGAGTFVAIGVNSCVSADGITWGAFGALPFTAWSLAVSGNSNGATFNRSAGRWLIYGLSTAVAWSPDGINWTSSDFTPRQPRGVASAQTLGRFYVALGADGGAYSSDGASWSLLGAAVFPGIAPNIIGFCAAASTNAIYAFGSRTVTDDRMCVWKSTDGVTFSQVYTDNTPPNGLAQLLTEGAVSDDGSKIVLQGFDSAGGGVEVLVYSDDAGASFTHVTTGLSTLANKLLGISFSAGNFYATKTNGQVWRGASGGALAVVETSIPIFSTTTGGPICNY